MKHYIRIGLTVLLTVWSPLVFSLLFKIIQIWCGVVWLNGCYCFCCVLASVEANSILIQHCFTPRKLFWTICWPNCGGCCIDDSYCDKIFFPMSQDNFNSFLFFLAHSLPNIEQNTTARTLLSHHILFSLHVLLYLWLYKWIKCTLGSSALWK